MDGAITGPGASGGGGYVARTDDVSGSGNVSPGGRTEFKDSSGKAPGTSGTTSARNADDPVPVGGEEAPVGGVSDMEANVNPLFGANIMTTLFGSILDALSAVKEGALAAVGSTMTGMKLNQETTKDQATSLKEAGEHKFTAAVMEGVGGAITAGAALPGAVATTKAISRSGSVLGDQQRALQKPVDDAYSDVGQAGDALNANKIQVNQNQTKINQLKARQAGGDTFTVSQDTTKPLPLNPAEEKELSDLKKANEDLTTETPALQQNYDQKKADRNTARQESEDASSAVLDNIASQRANRDEINQLETRQANGGLPLTPPEKQRVNELKQSNARLDESNPTLRNNMNEKSENLTNVNAEFVSAETALTTNKTKLSDNQSRISELEARQSGGVTAGTATVTTTPAATKQPLSEAEQTDLENLQKENDELIKQQTTLQNNYDQKKSDLDKKQNTYDQFQAEKPLALREHEYINGDKGVAWTRAYQPVVSGLGTAIVAPVKGYEEREATVDEANAALDAGYAAQFKTGTDASIQAAKDNNDMAGSMTQWLQSTSDNISRATHWGPA